MSLWTCHVSSKKNDMVLFPFWGEFLYVHNVVHSMDLKDVLLRAFNNNLLLRAVDCHSTRRKNHKRPPAKRGSRMDMTTIPSPTLSPRAMVVERSSTYDAV
eukprot:4290811-Amphidinium_carterae.1